MRWLQTIIIVALLLALIAHQINITNEISVHYVTTIQIWMIVHFCLYFAIILEFVLAINYTHKVQVS